MLPWFTEKFGNPGSLTHAYGREAEAAVELARAQLAALIGAEPREIVFTSGATEANNIAVKGAAHFHRPFGKDHIVTLATEHKCVLESCRALEARRLPRHLSCRSSATGWSISALPRRARGAHGPRLRDGRAQRDRRAAADRRDRRRSAARAACFSTPTRRRRSARSRRCRRDWASISLSISGHKMYGPKGIGALYVRRRPRARIAPLIDGGGQERGLRSGTLPTPLMRRDRRGGARSPRRRWPRKPTGSWRLRRRFLAGIRAQAARMRCSTAIAERRLPGNLNLSFPGVPAPDLMAACPGLALSSGSACTAAEIEPSYVLRALGCDDALAAASIRIGLGRFTTAAEVDFAVEALAAAVRRLQPAG